MAMEMLVGCRQQKKIDQGIRDSLKMDSPKR